MGIPEKLGAVGGGGGGGGGSVKGIRLAAVVSEGSVWGYCVLRVFGFVKNLRLWRMKCTTKNLMR